MQLHFKMFQLHFHLIQLLLSVKIPFFCCTNQTASMPVLTNINLACSHSLPRFFIRHKSNLLWAVKVFSGSAFALWGVKIFKKWRATLCLQLLILQWHLLYTKYISLLTDIPLGIWLEQLSAIVQVILLGANFSSLLTQNTISFGDIVNQISYYDMIVPPSLYYNICQLVNRWHGLGARSMSVPRHSSECERQLWENNWGEHWLVSGPADHTWPKVRPRWFLWVAPLACIGLHFKMSLKCLKTRCYSEQRVTQKS